MYRKDSLWLQVQDQTTLAVICGLKSSNQVKPKVDSGFLCDESTLENLDFRFLGNRSKISTEHIQDSRVTNYYLKMLSTRRRVAVYDIESFLVWMSKV